MLKSSLKYYFFHSGFGSEPKDSKYEVHARIPRVEMIAKYNIEGRVLVLPITGNGKSNLTLGKFNFLIKYLSSKIDRDFFTR